MMIVSDTSPITNLIQINKLTILKDLFNEILISQAVYGELCELKFQEELLSSIDWIKTKKVSDLKLELVGSLPFGLQMAII